MSANTLLMSPTMLKERTSIHGNIDDGLLKPDMKYAQDVFIKPVLGTALFEKLQTIVADGSISSGVNIDYKYLVDTYVLDALQYYSMHLLVTSGSFQFTNKGIIRKIGDNTEVPNMADLADIANGYKSRAEYYKNRMKLFLLDQSGRLSKYPEYLIPGSTVDTITPEMQSFTSPIFLGLDDHRDNPWCNPGGFNGQPYKD